MNVINDNHHNVEDFVELCGIINSLTAGELEINTTVGFNYLREVDEKFRLELIIDSMFLYEILNVDFDILKKLEIDTSKIKINTYYKVKLLSILSKNSNLFFKLIKPCLFI